MKARTMPQVFLIFLLIAFPSWTNDAAAQDAGAPTQIDLSERADVLIITSDDLAESWKPFADWKTQSGRPTKIVSISTIQDDFEGEDLQQKIRLCCLDHIENQNTRWVILGGDSSEDAGNVPDRDTDHTEYEALPYDNIPTDLYYISEKDWDANDDGVYGLFSEDLDEVEYFNPTACIGRIPVRTPEDVTAYTEKVIAYESRYPVGHFAKHMMYTCPEPGAYPKLNTSIDQLETNWEHGQINRFFANETPWDNEKLGDYDLTANHWADMINDRRASKMHMHGHGLLNLWALERGSKITARTISKLENKNAFPIITTVSCLTGQYDNKQDPSIAESMIRLPNAGAIAILAPSREGVAFMLKNSDYRLMMTEGKMDGTTTAYCRFWSIALGQQLTLGEAFRQVKIEMAEDAKNNVGFHLLQCELNLLGDPTLDPRAKPPRAFSPRVRISEDNTLTVRRCPNANICVWGDGDQEYFVGTTDKAGTFRLELGEDAKGKYRVTVSAPSFNIWSESIEVE